MLIKASISSISGIHLMNCMNVVGLRSFVLYAEQQPQRQKNASAPRLLGRRQAVLALPFFESAMVKALCN